MARLQTGALAAAALAAALAAAPAGAAPGSADRRCGQLARARIVKIEAERVPCRAARHVVARHAASVARRGSCWERRSSLCRIARFQCFRRDFSRASRIYCVARRDRKVSFRYRLPRPAEQRGRARR